VIPAELANRQHPPRVRRDRYRRTPSRAANFDLASRNRDDGISSSRRQSAAEQPDGLRQRQGTKTEDGPEVAGIAAAATVKVEMDRCTVAVPGGKRHR